MSRCRFTQFATLAAVNVPVPVSSPASAASAFLLLPLCFRSASPAGEPPNSEDHRGPVTPGVTEDGAGIGPPVLILAVAAGGRRRGLCSNTKTGR